MLQIEPLRGEALTVRAVSELPCDQSRIGRDSTVESRDAPVLRRHPSSVSDDKNKTTQDTTPEPHTSIRRKRKKTERSQYVITVLDYRIYHVD
jgi:hypothetical protein